MSQYVFTTKREDILEEQEAKDLISILKNENFGNEDQRKKFVDVVTSLLNMKEKEARQFFKKLGDACTDIASDMYEEEEVSGIEEIENFEKMDESTKDKIQRIEEEILKDKNAQEKPKTKKAPYVYERNR